MPTPRKSMGWRLTTGQAGSVFDRHREVGDTARAGRIPQIDSPRSRRCSAPARSGLSPESQRVEFDSCPSPDPAGPVCFSSMPARFMWPALWISSRESPRLATSRAADGEASVAPVDLGLWAQPPAQSAVMIVWPVMSERHGRGQAIRHPGVDTPKIATMVGAAPHRRPRLEGRTPRHPL